MRINSLSLLLCRPNTFSWLPSISAIALLENIAAITSMIVDLPVPARPIRKHMTCQRSFVFNYNSKVRMGF